MPSTPLNVISHCAKSPWFARSWSENALYGEYAGRLVLLSSGGDPVDEYWCLRQSVGLFDVPEKPLEIAGPDAVEFMNRVFTRSLDKLRVGRGCYGLLCHQGGGLVCDGIIFRLAAERFWYVHADAEVRLWLAAHAVDFQVDVGDPESWVLQVQGPESLSVLASAIDDALPETFAYFDIFETTMGGQPVLVSRTGWSAELGFEVYNLDPAVDGPLLWDHLLAAGAEFNMVGCGQLAMNIRRIEAGILNYGTDMNWHTTPYDMGLGAFVDLDRGDFVGREALLGASRETRFCGFKCAPRKLRYGTKIVDGSAAIGRICAYEISPFLESGVGFVLLDSPQSMTATGLSAIADDGDCPVELVGLPFYDVEKRIPRGLAAGADAIVSRA